MIQRLLTLQLQQPIRLLLQYCGLPHEDVQYICGDGPAYDRSSWLDVKHSLGLPFPNVLRFLDQRLTP